MRGGKEHPINPGHTPPAVARLACRGRPDAASTERVAGGPCRPRGDRRPHPVAIE